METPQEPPKGHVRTRSGVKATRPRSSTKGPLDDENPINSPLVADQVQRSLSLRSRQRSPAPPTGPASISGSGAGSTPRATSPAMPPRSPMRSPAPQATGKRIHPSASTPRLGPKDFSFLLRPEIYHPLTQANVPPPFRNPDPPPGPDTPIDDLLAQGHFRAAAIAAARALTSTSNDPDSSPSPDAPLDPTDHRRIFHLFYTRLACLTLIDATPLAAQEVKALGDLHSAFYYHTPAPPVETSSTDDTLKSPTQPQLKKPPPPPLQQQEHLVPWPLRVLAIRLQALGFGDPRRAVMSYYELAREARAKLALAVSSSRDSDAAVWRARLADLGVRVAGALAEMDDLAGAVEHLRTLPIARTGDGGGGHDDGMARMREALLWLQLGDVESARAVVGGGKGEEGVVGKVLEALCDMADGEYEAALGKWMGLREQGVAEWDEMVGVNAAVCLLYVGKMEEGRALLEQMVDAGRSSHTLLFNLSTMYELCTDRSRGLKARLAEKVALKGDKTTGWEKTNADFKL